MLRDLYRAGACDLGCRSREVVLGADEGVEKGFGVASGVGKLAGGILNAYIPGLGTAASGLIDTGLNIAKSEGDKSSKGGKAQAAWTPPKGKKKPGAKPTTTTTPTPTATAVPTPPTPEAPAAPAAPTLTTETAITTAPAKRPAWVVPAVAVGGGAVGLTTLLWLILRKR